MRGQILFIVLFTVVSLNGASDIELLDSLFDSETPHRFALKITDKHLRRTALKYSIDNYIKNREFKKLQETIVDPFTRSYISGAASEIDDYDMLAKLNSMGIEIINREFIKRHGTMENIIKLRDHAGDSLIVNHYTEISRDTLNAYIASRADSMLNNELIAEYGDKYARTMNIMLSRDLLPDNLTGYGLTLLKYTDKRDLLLQYSSIINDTISDRRLKYYRARYYEAEEQYEQAMGIYRAIGDSEAYIRMIAAIGNSRGRSCSDSILLADNSGFIPVLYHKAKAYYFNSMPRRGDSILDYLSAINSIDYYSTRARQLTNADIEIESIGFPDSMGYYREVFDIFDRHDKDQYFNDYIFRIYSAGKSRALFFAYMFRELEQFNMSIHYAYRAFNYGEKIGRILPFLFPQPYSEIFNKAALKHGADKALLYALARHESWFDPDARSSAGAMGIMQLMDFVYDDFYSDGDYFNVEKNINAGTAHIVKYLNYFPDNYAYGIMAYNAGPGNVRKWSRNNLDWELFLEMIPYRETRIFVKRIMRNYYYYRMLLNES